MWNMVAVMSCAHISPLWRMLVTSELLICLCVCVHVCVSTYGARESPQLWLFYQWESVLVASECLLYLLYTQDHLQDYAPL